MHSLKYTVYIGQITNFLLLGRGLQRSIQGALLLVKGYHFPKHKSFKFIHKFHAYNIKILEIVILLLCH